MTPRPLRLAPVLVLLLAVVSLPDRSRAIEQNEYLERLRALDSAVERARTVGPQDRAPAAAEALVALREIEAAGGVDWEGGVVTPYLGGIQLALSAEPPQLDRAGELTRELVASLEEAEVRPPDPAHEAALRDVLDDPSFRTDARQTLLQRGVERVGEWLRRVFGDVRFGQGPRSALTATQWLVAGACVLLVAGAVLLVARAGRRELERRGEHVEDDIAATADAAAMLARAAGYERAGDYRAAVRARFVALLLHLHERGLVRYDRSLTNREHLGRIGRGTPLAGALEPLVRGFDDVWYGNAPIDREGYERYRERADAVPAGAR